MLNRISKFLNPNTYSFSTPEEVIHSARLIMEKSLKYNEISLHSPDLVKEYLINRFWQKDREIFTVLFLDAQHKLIVAEDLFMGDLDRAAVYPRQIVKSSVINNASALIIAHNHPSGSSRPSAADEKITKSINSALDFFDIKLLDHIIVAATDTFSFAEKGMI